MMEGPNEHSQIEIWPMQNSSIECLAVTIPQVARCLSVGRSTVYKLINSGELPVIKIGKRTLVPMAALHSLVASKTKADA